MPNTQSICRITVTRGELIDHLICESADFRSALLIWDVLHLYWREHEQEHELTLTWHHPGDSTEKVGTKSYSRPK